MEYKDEKYHNITDVNLEMKEADALQKDDVPRDAAIYKNSRLYIE